MTDKRIGGYRARPAGPVWGARMMENRSMDSRRYSELTARVRQMLRETRARRPAAKVAPEDMALYLEWLAVARESSPALAPFVHPTSPYVTLRWGARSYRQMACDFHWLTHRLGLSG